MGRISQWAVRRPWHALVTWIAWATLMFQIGGRLMRTTDTRTSQTELMRTIGFAASPGLLQAFGQVTSPGRLEVVRFADAAPPLRPPFFAGALFVFLPRPEPDFLPPPLDAAYRPTSDSPWVRS